MTLKARNGSKEIDMLNGNLTPKIVRFALPLAISSILQQLFNSADVAIVGRFAGDDALAATGACVALVGIFVNLISGLSIGPNAALAYLIGQGRRDAIHDMLHTIITFAIIAGIGLMGLGFVIAAPVLKASGTPLSVLDQSILYMRIYFLGVPFMMIYNFGSAILRSFGDTRRPMFVLVFSGILNVGLNLVFVIVFELGVAGVAIATSLSYFCSCITVLTLLFMEKGDFHYTPGCLMINREDLLSVLKIGFPAGVQSCVFSVSNVFVQAGINTFGEYAIAGSAIALNFEYFTYFICLAFSAATTTFISQNYGAGNLDRCKEVYEKGMLFSVISTAIVSMIFIIFMRPFLRLYSHSEPVIEWASIRMLRVVTFEFIACSFDISSAALRGYKKSLVPAIFTILGTVVYRIIWMGTIFKWFPTFGALMNVYVTSWIFTGTVITLYYFNFINKKVRNTNSFNKD